MAKFLFILSLLFSSSSFALVDIAAVGGVTQLTQPSTGSGLNVTANVGKSFGLIANFHSGFGFGLTVGGLYAEAAYHDSGGSPAVDADAIVPYYVFPGMMTFWLANYVGIGAGAYYSTPAGNVTLGSTSSSFSSMGIKSDDYGLMGGIQIHLPLSLMTYFTASGFYEYGLENVSQISGVTAHTQGLIVLGGFGIGF